MKAIVIIGIILLVLLACFFANVKVQKTKHVVAYYVCIVSIVGLGWSLAYM